MSDENGAGSVATAVATIAAAVSTATPITITVTDIPNGEIASRAHPPKPPIGTHFMVKQQQKNTHDQQQKCEKKEERRDGAGPGFGRCQIDRAPEKNQAGYNEQQRPHDENLVAKRTSTDRLKTILDKDIIDPLIQGRRPRLKPLIRQMQRHAAEEERELRARLSPAARRIRAFLAGFLMLTVPLLFAVFLYGAIRFTDAPIRATASGFVGRFGASHTEADYRRFLLWKEIFLAGFPLVFLPALGLAFIHHRSRERIPRRREESR